LLAKLNWFGMTPGAALLVVAGAAAGIWTIWRLSLWRAIILAFLAMVLILSVLVGESADLGGTEGESGAKDATRQRDGSSSWPEPSHSRVFDRKDKCARAIERRRRALAKLEEGAKLVVRSEERG
jgi:hypothetical protein